MSTPNPQKAAYDSAAVEPTANHHREVSPFYTNQEAADFLRLSPRTMEKMRVIGGGPPFCKFGRRVFYTLPELEEWAGKRQCDSTSDPAHRTPSQ